MAGNMAFERMKAMRLFAAELRATTIEVQKKGGDQYESQLYLTQTGLKASRVMIVGTATEIEDIGTDGSFYRMRVSDPTGVFFVTAGQYQPEAAQVMQALIGKLPAFVTIVGKASLYTPKEGTFLQVSAPRRLCLRMKIYGIPGWLRPRRLHSTDLQRSRPTRPWD